MSSSRSDRRKQSENNIFSRESYRKSANKRSVNQSSEDNWQSVRRFDQSHQDEQVDDHSSVYYSESSDFEEPQEYIEEKTGYHYEQLNQKSKKKEKRSRQTNNTNSFVGRKSFRDNSEENVSNRSNRVSNNDPDLELFNDESYEPTKKQKKMKSKAGRKKKRLSGCGCLSFFLLIILLISGYCIGFFIKGQNDAHKETPSSKKEVFHGVTSKSGAKNILLIGNDSRDGENARADTIMVLSFDGKKKTPKIISIMRDAYVEIPGYTATKINATYAYGSADGTGGAELLRKTIEKSLDLPIKYYVTVDFHAFEKVIDALYPDGVAINAEKDMDLDGVFIKKGQQVMHGHKLLQYARFRHDPEGDFGRIRRQQQVMTAVFDKLKSPSSILRFPYAAGKAVGYTINNIPLSYYAKIGYGMLTGSRDIQRKSVPVDKTWDFGYTENGESVIFYNDALNAKAIKAFLEK